MARRPRPGTRVAAVLVLAALLGGGRPASDAHADKPAPVADTGSRPEGGPWTAPLPRVEVVHGFDPPRQRWSAGHRGVDLAALAGSRVRAAGAGTVSVAGMVAGVPVIAVVHGELRTTYQPVLASVRVGQRVAPGAVLGTLVVSAGHCLPAACLHWGLLRGRTYLDPLSLLGRGPPHLIPLGGPLRGPLAIPLGGPLHGPTAVPGGRPPSGPAAGSSAAAAPGGHLPQPRAAPRGSWPAWAAEMAARLAATAGGVLGVLLHGPAP